MSYAGKVRINNVDSPIASALYGVCTTQGGTAAKVVSLSAFDALINGVVIAVKFSQANTAANPTLNVNGTGDIPIYMAGNAAPGNTAAKSWASNSIVTFTYDSDNNGWFMNDAGVNTAIITLLEGKVTTEATARATADTQLYSRIAPVYDSTATYRKNDLVTYNEQLYRCNNDITTAEAWTAAHWTATTVAAEHQYKLVFTDVTAGAPPAATAAVSGTGITAATVTAATFATQISESGEYVFSYDGADWKLGGAPVQLVNYGIEVTGTAANGDAVTVTFTAAQGEFILQSPAVYDAYPYRASLILDNVRAAMIPQVTFAVDQAISGIFAPVAETDAGRIYIYASEVPGEAFTIPTIICWG